MSFLSVMSARCAAKGLGAHLAPVLAEGVGGRAQVVPGDLAVHVVGHMHVNVVAQELHPAQNNLVSL